MSSSSLDKEQKEFQDPELNMKYLNLQFLSFKCSLPFSQLPSQSAIVYLTTGPSSLAPLIKTFAT